jgi:hypothetical protein
MICWGAYANAILTGVLQIENNLDFGQSCKNNYLYSKFIKIFVANKAPVF